MKRIFFLGVMAWPVTILLSAIMLRPAGPVKKKFLAFIYG